MTSFVVKNNAESLVVDDPLAQSAVTLNVTGSDGANFPSTFPFLITIWDDETYSDPTDDSGMEIVKCTARTTDALTIVRAQEGTADVVHALGERVGMLITAGIIDELIADIVEDTTPQLGGTLDSNAHQISWSKGSDVASGTALTLGTDGNYFDITGTTTITSIATLGIGTVVVLHFDGILTLTHNAADLVLPGGANITTAIGDETMFVEYATGDWRCVAYMKADGTPLISIFDTITEKTSDHGVDIETVNIKDGSISELQKLIFKNATELTIATGVVTAAQSYHTIDTEADAATDDLVTINGAEPGKILTIRPISSLRTIVVKDGTGNLHLDGDFIMDDATDVLTLIARDTVNWMEQSRSSLTVPAASTTLSGVVELAITSEVNTGTDTTRAITPDSLGGSIFGTKNVIVKVIADGTALTTGDGKSHFIIPVEFNGMNLVSVGAHVYTVSSSGTPTFQIRNLTKAADVLSTAITIDATEKDSKDATTPAVINTATDDVSTGDEIRFDCDAAGTGAKGMEIRMGFRKP